MGSLRMLPLTTVANGFQARVIAARLGAAGVVAQLRGAVDGPYPIGDVRVEVPEDEYDFARELLLADEVEDAFVGDASSGAGGLRRRHPIAPWIVIGAAVIAEAVAVASRLS